LWLLIGLFALGGILAWGTRIPTYATGSAVVVDWRGHSQAPFDAVVLVAFLPPGELPRLQVGQTLWVESGLASGREELRVSAVERRVVSPEEASKRFGIRPGIIQQPAAVVMAELGPSFGGLKSSEYVGGVVPVDIHNGYTRVVSLLPLIGRFIKG
jgi:hypothetical protein